MVRSLSGFTPGRIGWHELYAADWKSAFAFYAGQFGWAKTDAIDMGPMGTYQLFAIDSDQMGGMMNKPEEIPVPLWLFYFNVEAIDAGAERVKANGGQILNGPMEVPGGSWIVQCIGSARRAICSGGATPAGCGTGQGRPGATIPRQQEQHGRQALIREEVALVVDVPTQEEGCSGKS